jgi:hypothetical protein
VLPVEMPANCSHEVTDDPLYADRRNPLQAECYSAVHR